MLLPLVNRSSGGGGISPTPEPKALLPIMTSSSMDGYIVTNSTVYDNRHAWKTVARNGVTTMTDVPNAYVNITFPRSVIVTRLSYTAVTDDGKTCIGMKNYIIYASNDNFSTLIELCSGTAPNSLDVINIDIPADNPYRYYRIAVTSSQPVAGASNWYFKYWQLYGYEAELGPFYLYKDGAAHITLENPGSYVDWGVTSAGWTSGANKLSVDAYSGSYCYWCGTYTTLNVTGYSEVHMLVTNRGINSGGSITLGLTSSKNNPHTASINYYSTVKSEIGVTSDILLPIPQNVTSCYIYIYVYKANADVYEIYLK